MKSDRNSTTEKSVTSSLDEREILKSIAKQLWALPDYRDDNKIVIICTWLKEGATATLVTGYSEEAFTTTQTTLSGRIDLRQEKGRRIGIVGRAMTTGKVQCVEEHIDQDPDYLPTHDHVRSELAVPIKIHDEVIGAITIEHSDDHAFVEEDQKTLQVMAAQASVAIESARRLRMVAARTVVAWVGMASTAWRHTIGNHATTIQDVVKLLHTGLGAMEPVESLKGGLDTIFRLAGDIRATPITAPLATEEGVSSVFINDLLQERLRRLWQREPYKSIQLRWKLDLATPLRVRMSSEWFTRAFDIVLDNAVEAMATSIHRELTVATQVLDNRVEIAVSDTGPGIPPDIQAYLFKSRVPKPTGEKGSGVGLLMAQTILQTYGGDIRIGHNGPWGATIVLWLPLEYIQETPDVQPGMKSFLLVSAARKNSWLPVLQEALSSLATVTVYPADEAVVHIARRTYDLILIDATAVEDVPLLITRIREQRPEVRIIVGGADPSWEIARAVLRAGALDYIGKSTSVLALRAMFGRVLEGQHDPFLALT